MEQEPVVNIDKDGIVSCKNCKIVIDLEEYEECEFCNKDGCCNCITHVEDDDLYVCMKCQ